ncbi:hypothetical protein ORI20_04630 [Mycobacterium sp. CVI_P3]|uniref:ESX-1 secretion-associated protein EspA/EspE-like domain-containing protein n=1 Tax=Mycobacterium pinniadriaticum TaxID=2994102 RepID=A0ABT3S8Z3_9MYCO|nr:hypothetical protein [Mycobacterium pinniadriaticum]MCX2929547.1 hypothetical protein [Mycobacterium pinniadriaticum]MCX2935971.1 hypothetical protein [Mycobacterium pinniadriaticum]
MSETPTEFETVSAVPAVDDDATPIAADEPDEDLLPGEVGGDEDHESRMNIVIRQVLERQIAVGQALSSQLIDAATDVTTAVAHAPATFAGAIQDGDTLAAAWERTGTGVQDVIGEAGGRLRAAVTTFVGHQATLPVAILGYAGEVAGSLASAQGTVAGSAFDGAFAVAIAATQGHNVREALGRNIEELRATATAARGDVNESAKRAGQEVRGAVGGELGPLVAAITGADEDS